MNQTTQPTLTSHQAYLVMFEFLRRYYERGQSDEIGGLLGGLQLLPDGQSADPTYSLMTGRWQSEMFWWLSLQLWDIVRQTSS